MQCPNCGTVNREQAKFCRQCSAPLTVSPPATPINRHEAPTAPLVPPVPDTAPVAPPAPATPPPLVPGSKTRPLSTVDGDTTELPGLIQAGVLTQLPDGEILNETYVIEAVFGDVHPGQKLIAYQATRLHDGWACLQCQGEVQAGNTYCPFCGASITDPSTLPKKRYMVRESITSEPFVQERNIAELHLYHDGIVPVHEFFSYTPYGSTERFYLVSDWVEGPYLSSLPLPQPVDQVLTWGLQLAEALAYLHENNVLHNAVGPESVILTNGGVKLTNFRVAQRLVKGSPPDLVIQGQARDTQMLAQMLYRLLTGLPAYTPGPPLPQDVIPIFVRAQAPDPAQGYHTAQELATDLRRVLQSRPGISRPGGVWQVGHASHVGRVRELNEDGLLVLQLDRVQRSQDIMAGLYVVADGMGGHQAGEVASGMAIQVVAENVLNAVFLPGLRDQPTPDIEAFLKDICQKANTAVRDHARAQGTDMGTTLVVALVLGNTAYIANVGDSRAYLINTSEIRQITTDHSLVERLVATGQITAEEARTHPKRNVIYRTIGDKAQVEADVFRVPLQAGDCLLLCSDGLSGEIDDPTIQRIVLDNQDPQVACQKLIEAANEAGGEDNITVVVIQSKTSW